MKACAVAVLLLFVTSVLAQGQRNLYPIYADGFETVWVDDMSGITEIHVQNFPPQNWTLFIYGSSSFRTIYPAEHSFVVGSTPNANWHLPFVDFHTVQNGTDLWGFGPIEATLSNNPRWHPRFGYELEIAVLSTKSYQYDRFQPLGFEGTFFSVRPLIFGPDVLGYFCGFFADPRENMTGVLHFGILRAFLNLTQIIDAPSPNVTSWWFRPSHDIAVLVNESQLITYNAFYKPHIYHVWNVTGAADPNTTYTIVIPPGQRNLFLALGSITPNTTLTVPTMRWEPPFNLDPFLGVTSTAYYYPYHNIILGMTKPGLGTGAIVFIHTFNFTTRGVLNLPINYTDPKALVIDEFNGTLYVAMNGGGAVLRIDIHHMNITGYQRTPPYLERAWTGHDTPEHLYFVTNEQHGKVFRLSKHDFCTKECPYFGYCVRGHCVCSPGFEEKDGYCQWATLVKDTQTIKKDNASLAALGTFFAIAVVAAGVGWFLVWRNRKQGYQAV